MDYLTGWSGWLIFGLVLLMFELILPGVFMMWWGFAALLISVIVVLFPLSASWQFALFALLAFIFTLFWWQYQHKRDKATHLHLNEERLLGMQGVIVEVVNSSVIRGKFGDSTWKVQGENLAVGDRVEVQRVDGITLFVRKI